MDMKTQKLKREFKLRVIIFIAALLAFFAAYIVNGDNSAEEQYAPAVNIITEELLYPEHTETPAPTDTPPTAETSIDTAIADTTNAVSVTSSETTAANITTANTTSAAVITSKAAASPAQEAEEIKPTYIDGVLIVNKTFPLPKSFNPGGLSNETTAAFNEMQKAAAELELSLYISSGFRTYERQKTIFDNNVRSHGKSQAEAFSARPGHSEHQTGLAFDLNTISDCFADTAEGVWVAQNAHVYGFIIRYPLGKEQITGYKYEPWHLRYVGVELAAKLFETGLTIEEHFGVASVYVD